MVRPAVMRIPTLQPQSRLRKPHPAQKPHRGFRYVKILLVSPFAYYLALESGCILPWRVVALLLLETDGEGGG